MAVDLRRPMTAEIAYEGRTFADFARSLARQRLDLGLHDL